jgi:hypothetical protein
VDDQPLAAGIEPSPAPVAESNLPAGGVLDALRVRWEEIAR